MISYKRLPGRLNQQALNGILDKWFGMPSWVKSYWATIKNKIAELQGLGLKISQHQQKLGIVKSILVARNDKNKDIMDDDIAKAADDLNKWWKVKGYIDTYLPQWMLLDQNVTVQPASGVGVVPFVLAGMALVALSYCVTTGMALLQDYAYKSQLTTAIIEQKITAGQAAEVLSVPRDKGVFETAVTDVVGNVGMGLGIGIPTALLVGGGIYLLITTGVLNKVIGGIFGGASSTPASGG